MCLAAAVAFSLFLPPSAANAWIDFLRVENARLEPEVEELELEEMVRDYRAGRWIRVAEWKTSQSHSVSKLRLILNDIRIQERIREGRFAPDALWDLMIERAVRLQQIEKEIEDDRRATRQREELQEMSNRSKSGMRRPRVDPDRFPELSEQVRKNLHLWARKRDSRR